MIQLIVLANRYARLTVIEENVAEPERGLGEVNDPMPPGAPSSGHLIQSIIKSGGPSREPRVAVNRRSTCR